MKKSLLFTGIQASVENYTFGGPLIKPVACTSVGIEGTINENELDAGERVSGFADSDGGVFAARLVYPGIQMFYRFNLADNNVIYTLTRTKALTAGKMYNFPAPTEIDNDKWRITAVNLGIKVGDNTLYWAKWNLGADSETYSPEYFSWGEATGSYWPGGKTNFFWDTYAWWDSDSHSLTKYCNNSSYGKNGYTDALTTLEKEDDAAFVTLGGKWRMPTDSEFQALMSLEKQWVTNYNNTGHSGYTFTGNGQTIFLTSALHWYQTSQSGSGGYYWSSSLYTNDPTRAMCLHFGSSIITRDWMDRSFGLSVRPVSE
ncbi:MAG: hypothetical protein VZQ48_07790 [Candidatus Cryptobacteroides sp.]|nr:hypothetical protein [Candidatus Cryptobacteroides sp.]